MFKFWKSNEKKKMKINILLPLGMYFKNTYSSNFVEVLFEICNKLIRISKDNAEENCFSVNLTIST